VPVADGYAAIGDSAFMPIPLVGSGMANAFRASRMLADTIIADTDEKYTAETLWDYAVKYHKELGAGLATLECVRSTLLQLKPQDVEFIFENDIINDDDLTAFTSIADVKELEALGFKDVMGKVKRALRNKYLIGKLCGAGVNMAKIMYLAGKMPEKWDKEKVLAWAKKYDKAFK
jgi:flavin-dependent dehydrogenase